MFLSQSHSTSSLTVNVPNIDSNFIIPALSFKLLFIYGEQLKLYGINSSSSQFRKLFSRIFPTKILHKLLVSPVQAKYFITLTTTNDLQRPHFCLRYIKKLATWFIFLRLIQFANLYNGLIKFQSFKFSSTVHSVPYATIMPITRIAVYSQNWRYTTVTTKTHNMHPIMSHFNPVHNLIL